MSHLVLRLRFAGKRVSRPPLRSLTDGAASRCSQGYRLCEHRDVTSREENRLEGALALACQLPVILAGGNRDADGRAVLLRQLGSQEQTVMKLDEAVAASTVEAAPPDLRQRSGTAFGRTRTSDWSRLQLVSRAAGRHETYPTCVRLRQRRIASGPFRPRYRRDLLSENRIRDSLIREDYGFVVKRIQIEPRAIDTLRRLRSRLDIHSHGRQFLKRKIRLGQAAI